MVLVPSFLSTHFVFASCRYLIWPGLSIESINLTTTFPIKLRKCISLGNDRKRQELTTPASKSRPYSGFGSWGGGVMGFLELKSLIIPYRYVVYCTLCTYGILEGAEGTPLPPQYAHVQNS